MPCKKQSESQHSRTIVITDSGLGGMSVFNDIASRLEKSSPWQRVRLVYFNAWPAPHRGYNHFATKEKRAQVFNNALSAMRNYNPDEILIACNTLSVIYPYTEFAKNSGIRVQGIVEHGVQMISEKVIADPESVAVIFGTPTTTNARTHESGLIDLGISKDRIINIGCTNLAGWIEREPFSDTVAQMIEGFVKETADKLGEAGHNVYAALCCTHFGYCRALFEKAFKKFIKADVSVLNPNDKMAEDVFEGYNHEDSFQADLSMHIVSQAVWEEDQINAYLKLLHNISPLTKDALINYEQNNNLFSVD